MYRENGDETHWSDLKTNNRFGANLAGKKVSVPNKAHWLRDNEQQLAYSQKAYLQTGLRSIAACGAIRINAPTSECEQLKSRVMTSR